MSEDTPTLTIETPADAAEKQTRPLAEPAKPDKGGFVWGTGRRKSAIARVRVKPGEGKFLINKREINDFLTEPLPHICHPAGNLQEVPGRDLPSRERKIAVCEARVGQAVAKAKQGRSRKIRVVPVELAVRP